MKKNKTKINFIKKYIVNDKASILDALKIITSNQSKACVVIKNNKFFKVVTDGDIRRALIKGFSLDDKIVSVHNRESKYVYEIEIKKNKNYLFNSRFSIMPILNSKNQLVDVITDNKSDLKYNIKKKKVAIIGLGYVGLTLALVLSEKGFDVIGYDISKKTINKIKKGESPFFERYIDEYLNKNLNKNFRVTNNFNALNADIYIICVGTPIDIKTKKPKIDIISRAVQNISKKIKNGDLLILRSTLPTGFTRSNIIPIIEKHSKLKAGSGFLISFSLERTIEGKALDELSDLPQIIGGYDHESTELSMKFFGAYSHTVIDVGSLEGAELCKLIDNSYRDVRFAYANHISLLCEELGLNAHDIISKVNLGYNRNDIAYPSPGVGGPCLSKDPYILQNNLIENNINSSLLLNARKINEIIPLKIYNRVLRLLKIHNKHKKNIKIFIIGFAFKGEPESSDMRDSTTLQFLSILKKNGFKNIYGYDPVIEKKEINSLGIKYCDIDMGFKNSNLVMFMNNHKSYSKINIIKLVNKMSQDSILYDGWNIYKSDIFKSVNNIKFIGIGK
mgnify:CR=1 FL=1